MFYVCACKGLYRFNSDHNNLVSESLLSQISIAGKYTDEHNYCVRYVFPILIVMLNAKYLYLLTVAVKRYFWVPSSRKKNFITRGGKKETSSDTEDKGTLFYPQ